MRSSTRSSSSPGGTRQSTISSARAGITLILSDALIRVGVTVTPSMASDEQGHGRVVLADVQHGAGGVAVDVHAQGAEQRARLVGQVVRGLRAQALEHRRHLQQRVVAQHGHRRVAGGAGR